MSPASAGGFCTTPLGNTCLSSHCTAKWINHKHTCAPSLLDFLLIQATTERWAEFLVLCSLFSLVIYFIHRFNGHGFGQPLEDSDSREAWHAAVHRVAKSWTWLSGWKTAINSICLCQFLSPNSSHASPFPLGIHIFVLYIWVSIPALRIWSSLTLFDQFCIAWAAEN